MKFRIKLTIFIFFLPLISSAQFWAEGIGGNDVDEVMDICPDNSGNIISAGYFTNNSSFGTINLQSLTTGVPDIFVQKCDWSGNPVWAVRAGGSGSDRALSVKCDGAGNIYITGFYFSSATFGSITLNSVNGSKDAFIAKLDNSGNFIWAVSAGGNLADIGNAIDIDASGNVFITGQFEGTASFGSTTYTSLMNPQTNQPSIDIFISKLDNNGNFLWTKQGAAPHTDRGLDIAVDNSGNAFICGQFSDTIQFTNTYLNAVMNAVFLMKVDGNGNELFFRKASGTYSIAYGLAINNAQDVYMTGDYQGTLAFYGPPVNTLSDNYSQRIFLAKYSNSGNFIWAASSSSDNYISSRSVALDINGDPYIAGEFGCTLNDYADVYGQGNFNSVGFKDIFTTKFSSSGQFQWSRNFGGPFSDQSHGILIAAVDKPILAGSFEERINWPLNSLTITSSYNFTEYTSSTQNTSYCTDPGYGYYRGIRTRGYSDGFIAQAVDVNRLPFDYYHRIGFGCSRPFVPGCIDPDHLFSCPDTARFCGNGVLFANTWTGSGLDYTIGPEYNFQWNNFPVDTLSSYSILTSGSYNVTMTTRDGCYTSTDTIYAIVNPVPPPPAITDDHNVNINQLPLTTPVISCAPDTVLLSAGNFLPTDSVAWYAGTGPGGNFITANDSTSVFISGTYNVVVTNQFGCTNFNYVKVRLDSALLSIDPRSAIPDSATICYGDYVRLLLYDTISNPAANPNYQLNYIANHWSSSPSLVISGSPQQMSGVCNPAVTGMYYVTDTIYYYNACNTDTFVVSDSIYITVNPVPHISLSITGPAFLCHGDTVSLLIHSFPSTTVNTSWTILPNDTILAWTSGNYGASTTITDTITGCYSYGNTFFTLQPKPNPVITTAPITGLICPNDSVYLMENTPGISYTWIGPNGILPVNAQNIYDSVPGFYHCIVTDADGCVLTSNTVELKQYNTPYLVAIPGTIVCLNQNNNVTLQVITNDTTLINWLPPLSGSFSQQTVTQSGTYSCNVTMCGITTLCSITVVVSQAIAQITGATSVCPGDSVWLNANSGMTSYVWSPGNSQVDSVFVPAGTYSLTTTDANGCSAGTSFTVVTDTSVAPPNASPASVCLGSSATLYATANGPVSWYTTPTGGMPIATGNNFTTPPINGMTTYFVETVDSTGCHSLRNPVTVSVYLSSITPFINANDSVCNGSTILLGTAFVPGVSFHWSGPNGFTSYVQYPAITNATPANSGFYTLYISDANCTSGTDSIYITVINPVVNAVSGNQTVCEGTIISVEIVNPDSGATYNWNGPNNFSASSDSLYFNPADTSQTGIYTITESLGGCQGIAVSYTITVLPAPRPSVISSNDPVCEGDTLFLFADTLSNGITYFWSGLNSGHFYYQQNPVIPNTDQTFNDYFTLYTIGSNGCYSTNSPSVFITVNPLPQTSLGPDSIICSSIPLVLYPAGNFISYLWQDYSVADSIVADSTGLYWVEITDQNGCTGSDSVLITTINCRVNSPNVFTPNSDGVNDDFSFIGERFISVNCRIFNRYGTLVYQWDDPQGKWNGTNMQTHAPVSGGVYYFVAEVVNYEGKVSELQGFVELIR